MLIQAKVKSQKPIANSIISCKLLLFFYCLLPIALIAQEIEQKPKIGLVLSGGGAKGLAHIGVLKEIEKAGIKIDYIAGTSMGAIVGGLYASGYTAHELDSIFTQLDADAILQDVIPRKNKTFYEKNNDELYAITLPFQNLKVTVPKAISKGLYNYNLISKLTYHNRHITDFNKLPIPFACVATNIETGEETVFRNGSLPLCLAASGAFPSLYSPVEIDGKHYIDGGVTNNYPVEELIKMGATYIIGVDVQDDLKKVENIKGVSGVLSQISNYQMLEKMKDKKKLTNLYIKPNIKGFSVISFEEGKNIIKLGEDAGLIVKDTLNKLGANYTTLPKIKNSESIKIDQIGINGLKNYTRSYVLGKLRIREFEKFNYTDLHNGINNLNATQNFSSINYYFQSNAENDNLILTVKENPVKTFLKLGIHYDDLFKASGLVNVTKKNLVFKNDVGSLDIILGDNFRYKLDYYVDNGFHFSYGIKSSLDQFKKTGKTDFLSGQLLQDNGKETIDIDYNEWNNQLYVQTLFFQRFLIGLGIQNKSLKIFSNTIQYKFPKIDNSNYSGFYGFLKYDSFNNKHFPKKGWYFNGEVNSYLFSSDYRGDFSKITQLSGDAAIVQSFFKNKISFKLQSEAGISIGEGLNHVFDYVLGGYGFHKFGNFKPFFGYDFLELSEDSYIKGSSTIDYEFIKKYHLNATANFANVGQKIFDSGNWLSVPSYSGYALGLGMETLIGPVELKQSWSPETNKHYTWFTIGFWF